MKQEEMCSARLHTYCVKTTTMDLFPAQTLQQIITDDKIQRNTFALFEHAHHTMETKTPTTSWPLSSKDCVKRTKMKCVKRKSRQPERRRDGEEEEDEGENEVFSS